MSFRRRRRRLILVLGLAVAAVGAGGAQAKVIPYLSHGQGISSLQMAQLQNTTPSVESQYMAPSGRTAGPSIAVGGKYLDAANQYAPGSWNTPEFQADLDAITNRTDWVLRSNDRDPAFSGVPGQQDSPVRPDDRANHGPLTSRVALNDSAHASVRPDDRAVPRPLPTEISTRSTGASSGDGFSWSDAGVGAGSALGLILVAGAAMFTLRRGRKGQLAGA